MLRTGGTPVTAGPMDAPTQGRRQCTAKSTTTGERCTKAPIRGGPVCATHGGSAPQVRKKAALRLLELVDPRSEEHTSELQSLMRISYAVFCLYKQMRLRT